MAQPAIRTEGLSKLYRIGEQQGGYKTLRDSIANTSAAMLDRVRGRNGHGRKKSRRSIWALNNVSLEVQNGEVVGIIGRNGAGKSTLLKVLSRITLPTKGYAEIRGRVGSLLEVGTGFHPELTGRENIFLNGVILGMSRSEVASKFDQIVEFAEVAQFIDTPVKRYSSGMYLRLAFSVAAHLEPEILLVDEVLAVGDARFQKRCLQKMGQVAKEGRTVLFVSHNMAAVRQLCSKAILLGGGGVEATGTVSEVIRSYLRQSFDSSEADLTQIVDRKGKGDIRISAIRFEDEAGHATPGLVSGRPGRIVISVESSKPHRRVQACVGVLDEQHQRLMYLNSFFVGDDIPELPPNGELVCNIPRVHLAPGEYNVELWVKSGSTMQDRISDAGTMDVIEGNFYGTGKPVHPDFQVALMDFKWEAKEAWGEPN